MSLYRIYVQHFSQKDSHTSIHTFLLASSDEEVYNWVEGNLGMHCPDEDDEDYLHYRQKMIDVGGEYFDEEYEPQDLYYGHTIYGWEKLEVPLLNIEIDALEKVGMLEKIKKEK